MEKRDSIEVDLKAEDDFSRFRLFFFFFERWTGQVKALENEEIWYLQENVYVGYESYRKWKEMKMIC